MAPPPGSSTFSQTNIIIVEMSWHGRKPMFKFKNSQFLEAEAEFEFLVSTWSSSMTSPANPALAACKAFLANLKLFELISFFQHQEQRDKGCGTYYQNFYDCFKSYLHPPLRTAANNLVSGWEVLWAWNTSTISIVILRYFNDIDSDIEIF